MLLDVTLLVMAAGIAFAGYRQGFVTGVLSVVGLVIGAFAGMQVAPHVANRFTQGTRKTLAGIVVVLIASSIGQLAGTAIGAAIRRRIRWHPVQRMDAVGGAVVSTVGILVISWLIATEVKDSPLTFLARQVNHSQILRAVDAVMPPAPNLTAPFRRMISRQDFPQVFANLHGGRARSVPAPDPAVLGSKAVTSSRRSIVRITGVAAACQHRVEGSGFVFADDYVMTNAHVVAGVAAAQVTADSGRPRAARVVLFDPKRDVAVLHVDHLGLPSLDFAGTAHTGDTAVVAGFPEDGPFSAVAARVRDQLTAVGRDIYERGNV
ncbi:MAG: MarP family serine protease, partial [Actinomycetota bacterium]